jgi:hypothetical protein
LIFTEKFFKGRAAPARQNSNKGQGALQVAIIPWPEGLLLFYERCITKMLLAKETSYE